MDWTKTHFYIRKKFIIATSFVFALATFSFLVPSAHAYVSAPYNPSYTSIAAAPNGGYWVQVSGENGGGSGTRAIDGAPQFENVAERGTIASIPGREGYWVVTPDGRIHERGDAPGLCGGELSSCSGFPESPGALLVISAVAAHPNGLGLWAVDTDGRVWTAGQATSFGDVVNEVAQNMYPSGIAATPSGNGYYIVMRDGGVHARGDAVFYGSTGGNRPYSNPMTGITLSYDIAGTVNGYWLLGSDGGVFTFGNAPFLGSTGGNAGNGNVTNIATSADHRSYVWVHRDGHIERSQSYDRAIIKSNKWSGTALDVQLKSNEAGAPLAVVPLDGSPSQVWDIWPTDWAKTVFQLRNVGTGLCADLERGEFGGRVLQWPCKARDEQWNNQRWAMTNDGGSVKFASNHHPTHFMYVADEEGDLQVWIGSEANTGDPLVIRWTPESVE